MNNPFYFSYLAGSPIIAAFLVEPILARVRTALVVRARGVEPAAALKMEASR